jgi:hypothetical protein
MSGPVPKFADQLVIGDRVPDQYLPHRFNKGPAEVVFGQHDSTTVLSAGRLMVHPADLGFHYTRADDDPETTQPLAGRGPAS